MLATLYFQNTTSYRNYLYLLQNSYQDSVNNSYNSFQSNLINTYKNITSSLQNAEQLDNKKIQEKLVLLQKNNLYLQNIQIDHSKSKQDTLDIIIVKNIPYYKITIPIIGNFSSIEYWVDTNILLSHMKSYNKSQSILFFKDRNDDEIKYYQKIKESKELFSKISECCRNEQKNLLNIDSKFYVSNLIQAKNSSNKPIFDILFFLDVTKEKLEYKSIIKNSMITSILLFIFAAIVVNYFFGYLINTINKNEENLKEINKNLEERVNTEIEQRLNIEKVAQEEKEKNEQMLIQQSKLAMMGEMIGNIAHQWRQPLMQLSAIIMYLDAYNDKGKLTKERFQKKIGESVGIIDYMSKTIEDFRNYYKPEKQKELFYIKESIEGALFIIDSSLKNSFITVQTNYSDETLKILSFKNEFSQAILNILSNAKDILIQRKIKNPQINIEVYSEDDVISINIEDNAEGIEPSIIDKIFDPYFTTKHKSQGTGIGLYMSKMIVNNINGEIKVINTPRGAKFTILVNNETL